jgi:hypothetical protein
MNATETIGETHCAACVVVAGAPLPGGHWGGDDDGGPLGAAAARAPRRTTADVGPNMIAVRRA